MIGVHAAGAGGEIRQFLSIDAHFDGMAIDLQILLRDRQGQACGHADLFAHKVHTENGLGDRVFDLKPGVHFDEKELAVFIQEFDGAGTAIADIGHGLGAGFANARAGFGVNRGAGRFFQHLLVAPLQRTVALAQMDGVAAPVTENLHFDMTRLAEVLFDIHFVIAKGSLGFGPRGAKGCFQLARVARQLHAAPAAACRGLDDNRVADALCHRLRGLQMRDPTIRTGHARHAKCFHRVLGGDLVAHHPDMFRRRPDKGDTVIFNHLHEFGVFRQKAITRVDRFRTRNLAGGNDRRDGQITMRGRGRADADRLIRHAHMHCIGVSGGMHRDRGNAHFAAGADHAKRDFPAIGDQDFLEHAHPDYSIIISGAPNSTGDASPTRMRLTTPARGAGMWFMVFIASIISKVSPSATCAPTLTKFDAPGSGAR